MLTRQEKLTIDYYDKHSGEWVEKHGASTMTEPDMVKLFELVPKGKVLEIGVGSGKDAKRLIDHFGLKNYVGVEPALGLLKIARGMNPQAEFINNNIYDIEFPDKYFDSFWISAILIHLPKNKLVKTLIKVNKFIKPGSIGFISVMEGNADLEENRIGRFYSLWSQKEFESELRKGGFKVIRLRKITQEKGSPWLDYLVKTV